MTDVAQVSKSSPQWCPKCNSQVQAVAWQLHHDLNHPKRVPTEATLKNLGKAQAVRAQQLAERKARAEILTDSWKGIP